MYPIHSGGPYAINSFYFDKSRGKLIDPSMTVDNCFQEDYDLLDVVAQIQIPLRTWVVINSKVLHGVENIDQGRVVIHASINDISKLKLRHALYYGS